MYDKLYNRFQNDKSSMNSKKWKKNLLENNATEELADVMVEVIGIYFSNTFLEGVGIKTSRFNHSCNANAEMKFNERLEKFEIIVNSKIKAGDEITINYNPTEISIKKFHAR